MAASKDGEIVLPLTPQSSKKRKSPTNSEEPSRKKKKRKQDKLENGILTSQETEAPKKEEKKKKRREKKDREDETIERPLGPQEIEDTALLDAPIEQNGAISNPDIKGVSTTNDDDNNNGFAQFELTEEVDDSLLHSEALSCFYEKRLSLQLPIPSISLESSTSSVLALHLAPLLLTYFPPAEGIVLSFSDPVLSAKPGHGINLALKPPQSGNLLRDPPDETFARCADAFGVCWVWLTVTLLVFRPETGDELKGWSNVISEGFVGLVSYNYFQTAVGKARIPKDWVWSGPMRENDKTRKQVRRGKLRDEDEIGASQQEILDSQDTSYNNAVSEQDSGSFTDAEGNKISAMQTFSVVDVEIVPGHERDRWTLQIDGSLLSPEEELAVIAEERQRFEQAQNRSRSRSKTVGLEAREMAIMSGELPFNRPISPS